MLPNAHRPWKRISRNSDRGHPAAKQGIKDISNLSFFEDLYPEQWQWQEGTASVQHRAGFGTRAGRGLLQGIRGCLQGCAQSWWNSRISGYLGLCASCLGTEPQGQMGTGGSSSRTVAERPVRCRGHPALLGTCRQRLSPVLCHCRRFLRMGGAFWPPPRGRQGGRPCKEVWLSLAVLRCPFGGGWNELQPLSCCPCQDTSKECSLVLWPGENPTPGVLQVKEQ